MTTWRELISECFESTGDSWDNVKKCAMPDGGSLDAEFDDGFGLKEGCAFTLWTKRRVYFPVDYDGAESVASVPRNPCLEATEHVGGGG